MVVVGVCGGVVVMKNTTLMMPMGLRGRRRQGRHSSLMDPGRLADQARIRADLMHARRWFPTWPEEGELLQPLSASLFASLWLSAKEGGCPSRAGGQVLSQPSPDPATCMEVGAPGLPAPTQICQISRGLLKSAMC